MQKSFDQNLANLSVILVLLFYCLVMMVSSARGSHVTNPGIEPDEDDNMKTDETSLAASEGKQLEPLHSATEYRLVTTYEELEMESAAGNYNKSKTWLWSQQQQPFQLCLSCKCCMSAMEAEPSNCTSLPCCFVIDCQLPNKPYGVCAFVPKTCNCTSCATPLL